MVQTLMIAVSYGPLIIDIRLSADRTSSSSMYNSVLHRPAVYPGYVEAFDETAFLCLLVAHVGREAMRFTQTGVEVDTFSEHLDRHCTDPWTSTLSFNNLDNRYMRGRAVERSVLYVFYEQVKPVACMPFVWG